MENRIDAIYASFRHLHPLSIEMGKQVTFTAPQIKAFFAFLAGGRSGVIQRWLQDGVRESPEEIAALIIDFCEGAAGKFAGHAY